MRIGLSLSGGGARGAFHIGLLKALDESEIKISVLSGTSAGALVGCLYAAGVAPQVMLQHALETSWFNFIKPALPDRGLIGMKYLDEVLRKYLPHDDFSKLKIPLKITATNLLKGKLKVFDKGAIIQPVLASCSIPLLFKPVYIQEEPYLDGGILMNLPADIIRRECDFLIGVSLMPVQEISKDELNNSFKLMTRILELSVNNNSKQQMSLCDHLIEAPGITYYSRFDLKAAEELFYLGFQTGLNHISAIQNFIRN